MSQLEFLDALFRGGVMAMTVLTAARLLRWRHAAGLARLAAAFALGIACYAIISTPLAASLHPAAAQLLLFVATLNSAIFWWFAIALFDDDFEWDFWKVLPALFLITLFLLRLFQVPLIDGFGDEYLQQLLILAMMVHALVLSLVHYKDDLVEERRQFRMWFAPVVATTGLVIALIEIILDGSRPPSYLTLLHAGAMFLLCFVFCSWILANEAVFRPPSATASVHTASDDDAIAATFATRLSAVMDAGAYKEEGLSIAMLAEKLSLPEYRLRRLINRNLGYKNFSAYMNEYRIRDAKAILANADEARRQITLIALDLGYGSIATFNRAFRQETGVSPREYRKAALAGELPSD